jgi:hypothetical protein
MARAEKLTVERRRQAEKVLSAENHQAMERVRAAFERVQDLVQRLPSRIPFPDSDLQVAQAKREYRQALDHSTYTLKRLVNFVLEGNIPDDLEF